MTSELDWQADLRDWGRTRGVPVFLGNANAYAATIADLRPDFLVSLQYRFLVPPELLRIPTRGAFNLHFGLLPRYGGCYPVAWAILNGETRAGATLHVMSERFDEGDVLAQMAVEVDADMSARGLFDRLTEAAVALFEKNYVGLVSGTLKPVPQDPAHRLYYAKDSIDFERDRRLDWRESAAQIHRKIRAFSFEPFQLPVSTLRVGGRPPLTVTVTGSHIAGSHATGPPGSVLGEGPSAAVRIAAGDGGVLEIATIEGKPALEFLKSEGAFVAAETRFE